MHNLKYKVNVKLNVIYTTYHLHPSALSGGGATSVE